MDQRGGARRGKGSGWPLGRGDVPRGTRQESCQQLGQESCQDGRGEHPPSRFSGLAAERSDGPTISPAQNVQPPKTHHTLQLARPAIFSDPKFPGFHQTPLNSLLRRYSTSRLPDCRPNYSPSWGILRRLVSIVLILRKTRHVPAVMYAKRHFLYMSLA